MRIVRRFSVVLVPFFLIGCLEIEFSQTKKNKSDDDYCKCTDRCVEEYDKCIDRGNTESACGLRLLDCQNACKPPEE